MWPKYVLACFLWLVFTLWHILLCSNNLLDCGKITVYWSVLLCTVLINGTFHWNTHCYENIVLWVCLFCYSGICSVCGSFVHSLDMVCKISIYHFHLSVSIFVLLNYWNDLDNIWCVGLRRSYEVSGAVPVLALYAFMTWTETTLSFVIIKIK
jgi:hypothetical protein